MSGGRVVTRIVAAIALLTPLATFGQQPAGGPTPEMVLECITTKTTLYIANRPTTSDETFTDYVTVSGQRVKVISSTGDVRDACVNNVVITSERVEFNCETSQRLEEYFISRVTGDYRLAFYEKPRKAEMTLIGKCSKIERMPDRKF